MASFAALAAAVAACGTGAAPSASAACSRPVTGGTAAEQAAVTRILCLMPGTRIESVLISERAPDAPAEALWLAVTIPAPPRAPGAASLLYTRAKWEADVAAAAVRDGFVRLGLRHVVAYQTLTHGAQPDVSRLFGIARPEWKVRRWSTGAAPRTLGRGAGTWAALQARLSSLSRRFGVTARLERYNPFGKAPVVTVTASRAGRFVDAGGLRAYQRALRFDGAVYDGVFLELDARSGAARQVFVVDRGRRSSGCSAFGRIPHRRFEICPLD
jgi:hypothetical protein